MKSNIIALFALFFFLVAGTTSAASISLSSTGLKSLQADTMCGSHDEKKKDKKKKQTEEEEPECD